MQMRQEVNIVSHVVDHIKCSRNIFPFTLMKEGISQRVWNIIRASYYSYSKLYQYCLFEITKNYGILY